MELTPEQIWIIGIVASLLAALLRLLVAKFGNFEISKFWMTIIVAVVAFVLAVVFGGLPALPPYLDPFQYVLAWATILTGYLGAATAIYNLILDKVLNAVGLDAEKLAAG